IVSDWNEKVIELRKFAGSPQKYREQLEWLSYELQTDALYLDPCGWKKIPTTIVAIEREYRAQEELGVLPRDTSNVYRTLIADDPVRMQKCGIAPAEYLGKVK